MQLSTLQCKVSAAAGQRQWPSAWCHACLRTSNVQRTHFSKLSNRHNLQIHLAGPSRSCSRSSMPFRTCSSASLASNEMQTELASRTQQHVEVTVERAGNNSRCLYAGIDVAAPIETVWEALTDYDALDNFIPGLAENRCLSRYASGARLLQVGEQDLTLGIKFRARVVLDIAEHPDGLRPELIDDSQVKAGFFPQPRTHDTVTAPRDITFSLVESRDFQAFKGVWRMQEVAPLNGGPASMRLSYALYVKPQTWLPVRLIQGRIEGEVISNLQAVQKHAERSFNRDTL